MDLDNQNSAANTNTDSATPDFGGPVDVDKPSLDMDAINEAIAATGGKDPNLQTSFDVNDISLDDVPQSQDELDKRLKEDPEMSLAGGAGVADAGPTAAIDLTQNASSDDPLTPSAPVEEKTAPVATFVDGDTIDEVEEPAKTEATPSYDNINTDPLSGIETGAADSNIAKSLGEPAVPVSASIDTGTPADAPAPAGEPAEPVSSSIDAGTPADAPAPAREPAHIANTITVPGQKSKLPLIIGIAGGVLAIVIIALIILTASK